MIYTIHLYTSNIEKLNRRLQNVNKSLKVIYNGLRRILLSQAL